MVLTSSTIGFTGCSSSRLDMNSLLTGASKVIQASTISDSQIRGYVQEYIAYSDQQNKVAPANNPYAVRLARLTSGLTSVDGVPLNFKVYLTNDVNAFACADGSVRVYSGLMDRMTDDEVLGVIGHEIGHVAHKDTKNAFKNALLTSALLDGVASTGGTAAALT
ncbi:MAG: M48 family metalloprotease, partial [Muribaculaceae bacterium]|nr:M48 family metalloprotease [Muribaculaceae bacterium]